jgi:CCR4-NOT transcription complex subunit 7/8
MDTSSASGSGMNDYGTNSSGGGNGPIAYYHTSSHNKRHEPAADSTTVNVWADNLHEEMAKIIHVVQDHPYIAMDTEFPGVVARPTGNFKNPQDFQYQSLKCNVDLLKIIQLGLTFFNSEGKILEGVCTWQFNFKFLLSEDMYAQDSITLLEKAGIDFKTHESKGIDVNDFAELLMTSGLVLSPDVKWISFHSGYDFGYLIKMLTCQPLPKDEAEFFEYFHTFFPTVYDLKYMMQSCESLTGGLNKLADDLAVDRIGPEHQAGSDSLVTGLAFFKMRSKFFGDVIDDEKFSGFLFGLGHNIQPPTKKKEIQD